MLKSLLAAFGLSRPPEDRDVCIACGSPWRESIAPGAYRCRDCGYEGGEGYAAHRLEQRRLEIEALPREERRAQAIDDLRRARTLLEAAKGSLEAGIATLGAPGPERIFTDEPGPSQPTAALEYLAEAEAALRDVQLKSGIRVRGVPDLSPGYGESRANEAADAIDVARARIDVALGKLRSGPATDG